MFGKKIPLFQLLGFKVSIDPSWFILAFLIVWSLAAGVFPFYFPGFSGATYLWMGVAGAVGLFLSIVIHEFSHSLVARRFGLPITGITLFIFGGVAEMEDEPPSAKAEFFMAAAGPASSIAIGIVLYGIALAGTAAQWPVPVRGTIGYLALINIILAVFNLLPAFPLDGGRVLRSILWAWKGKIKWATRTSSAIGSGFGLLLIGFGVFFVLTGNVIGGFWWVLIGFFLRSAAQSSYRQLMTRQLLEGQPVSRFMKRDPVTVTPDLSIDHLVTDYVYQYHFQMYPVVKNGHLQSCVTTNEIKSLPRDQWSSHTVGEVAHPCSPDNTISPDDDAVKALTVMSRTGQSRLMAVDSGGNLAGVITLKDLLEFLSLKMDLEEETANRK